MKNEVEIEISAGTLRDIGVKKDYLNEGYTTYNVNDSTRLPVGDYDWRAFYNDGENVFLISTDVLLNEKIPFNQEVIEHATNFGIEIAKKEK